MCDQEQDDVVLRKHRSRMAIPEYTSSVWNDEDDLPLDTGDQRKIQIAELLQDCVTMRPCRRHGDSKRKRIRSEINPVI
jgi:hypothetical protein